MKRPWAGVWIVAAVLAVFVWQWTRTTGNGTGSGSSASRQEQLARAVELTETGVKSLVSTAGDWTPSKAASHYVRSMAGNPSGIPVQEDQPFEPWQIALVPDEAKGVVRIEGYGADLSSPLIIKEVPVR